MSADADIVRDDLTDVKAWAFYYAPEPLKEKLERVLARLEAAEDEARHDYLNERAHHVLTKGTLEEAEAQVDRLQRLSERAMDALEAVEEQRDALAEALREILADGDLPPEWSDCACSMCVRIRNARAALAEAGLA